MKATLFKEVGYSLSKLIEDIDVGEIGLPDIQRPFVWTKAQVRDLFDSMYTGFPVGYLLFWSNVSIGGVKQIGVGKKQAVPRLLIVDGQQRLTSLYAVLKGVPVVNEDYSESHIRIAFRPRDETFAVADAAKERDPEFIADISQLWAGPVGRNRFVKSFLGELGAARQVSEDEEDHLTEAIDRLYDLQSYPFTALELSSTIDEEKVAEVFVRINSKGVTLNQADFILTLMSVWWDEGRTQLESFSRASRQPSASGPSPFNHFIKPDPDQLLRVAVGLGFRRGQLKAVYSLLRGRDLETGLHSAERRDQQFEVLEGAQTYTLDLLNWHEFLKILVRAGFRSDRMITSQNALLYAYVFYLTGKRDFRVPHDRLREVMAQWFFMASLTGRYSSSPETRVEADLTRLRGLTNADEFVKNLQQIIDDTLTDDFWNITLPNDLATQSARSPSLYAYYASLNLLDARLLFSKMRVSELFDPALRAKRSAVERHHLFPRAYLKQLGIESLKDVNQIANYALVEWPDNSAISSTPPAEYYPTYAERHDSNEMERMRFWHALPEGWEHMSYSDFIVARRRMLAKVIRAGFDRLKAGEEPPSEPGVSIADLVAGGENDEVEFKSSARWNAHIGERDQRLELEVPRAIAGFANARGGTLVVGVNDGGAPLGLENDLQLVKKHDFDGYQLWLADLLTKCLGRPAATSVRISFPQLDGHRVCRLDVEPAVSPVFVNPPGGEKAADFYVRIGASTRQLTTDEVLSYQRSRWP